MKKLIIAIIIVASTFLVIGCSKDEIETKDSVVVENNAESTTKKDSVKVPVDKKETRPRIEVINEMHKMANTKIEADEIRGRIMITYEQVNELIAEVEASDYRDKKKLLKILNNWKSGYFEKCVSEHNYLWKELGGEVGKATGLKK